MSSQKKQLLKVIILGDSGVGKTCLLNQYVSKKWDTRYKATIGADFMTKDIEINGQDVTFQLWDTAGQERFQSLGAAFYRGADAFVLVFDVTASESFQHISGWKEEFIMQAGAKPCVLLGNKCDLDTKRTVPERTAKQWCQQDNVPYYETSAKDNTNVTEAFKHIAELGLAAKPPVEEGAVLPTTVNMKDRPKQSAQKKKDCPC
jgi:Ras-related protein Rab-7A